MELKSTEPKTVEPEQPSLLEVPPDWKATWGGMPVFNQKDLEPWQSIMVHFKGRLERMEFAKLIGQTITDQTRSLWYPKVEIGHFMDRHYGTEEKVNPKYPIYIISKGRWESRMTSKALEKIGVPYRIVVEPQEVELYGKVINPAKILTLPFSNLGQGSIPARNWVWDHSQAAGDARHWILDDNIEGFYRLNENLKVPVSSGATFRAAEEFVDRYTNVGIAGFQYFMFAPRKSGAIKPFTLNTRIYSCILIDNKIGYRWRGRYNEDTDLSIRVLKDGLCTVLFNAFLAFKATTMTMKGGNTDELYQGDGRLKMAQSLKDQHPELVEIVEKWGRWQHHVNYKVFRRNQLILRPGFEVPAMADNFGMNLKMRADDEPESVEDETDQDQGPETVAEPVKAEETVAAPALVEEPKPAGYQPQWEDYWKQRKFP